MIRLSILAVILFYFSHVWADPVAACKSAAKTAYDECRDTAKDTLDGMNLSAAQLGEMCADTPNVPACSTKISNLGGENNGKIDYAVNICEGNKSQCKSKCDPKLGKDANEKQFLTKQRDDCASKIDKVKNQLSQGKPGNQSAKEGGQQTAASSGASPMPPMALPQSSPSSDSSKDQTPQTADSSSPSTPAAAAPASPSQSAQAENKTGTAGFKTASQQAIASVCGSSSNPSEISGCPVTSAATAEAAMATQFPAAGGTALSGGGGGSSSGGGSAINAAQVAAALAGQNKNGESEKDGKNSGLKAASINLGTDGGGGGGGSSAGGNLPDFDFGMKPSSVGRRPAGAAGGSSEVTTVAGNTSVATQRFSVVKIVTDVYQDRCSKSRFLHCGTNK